jgi:hypothetical protein
MFFYVYETLIFIYLCLKSSRNDILHFIELEQRHYSRKLKYLENFLLFFLKIKKGVVNKCHGEVRFFTSYIICERPP